MVLQTQHDPLIGRAGGRLAQKIFEAQRVLSPVAGVAHGKEGWYHVRGGSTVRSRRNGAAKRRQSKPNDRRMPRVFHCAPLAHCESLPAPLDCTPEARKY